MNVFRFILLFCIAVILFLITGCYDAPNSVGRGSQPLGEYGIVHIDTFYATAHSSDTNLIYTSSLDRFMVGNYKTYQAWACLKFYSWPDSLIGVNIRSATILLKGAYHFGDSLAPLSFNAYRAVASLMGDSLTYDSLNNNPTFYYNSSPLSIQTSISGSGDTSSIAIKILDVGIFKSWFSSNTDTMNLNDGIILKPTNTNVIKGYYSFNADSSLRPMLIVNYIDTNGVPRQAAPLIFGSTKFLSTVNKASLMTDNNLIYVQSGISYRGLISFDSISIPWPVSVYRAVLQVTLNPSQSSSQYTPFAHDTMYALSVGSNDNSDAGAYGLSQRSDSSGFTVYSFEIKQIVARMLSNASIRKIALSGYSEASSFDLHTLYGAISNQKLKPKLIITYSSQH